MNTKKAKSAELQKKFAALERESQQKFSDAKAELGLWSDAGIGEGRQLFWSAFERGKVFGRRQTFWDALVSASDQILVSCSATGAALASCKLFLATNEGIQCLSRASKYIKLLFDCLTFMNSIACFSLQNPDPGL